MKYLPLVRPSNSVPAAILKRQSYAPRDTAKTASHDRSGKFPGLLRVKAPHLRLFSRRGKSLSTSRCVQGWNTAAIRHEVMTVTATNR